MSPPAPLGHTGPARLSARVPGGGPRARRADEAPAPLVGIGEAAARSAVSVRALRYYQEIGLLTPHGRTPGGMRRYCEEDLARVRRIRELQSLLGLNLEEVREVLANEDRMAALRRLFRESPAGSRRRSEVAEEMLVAQESLRATVAAKITSLTAFLGDLDASIARVRAALAGQVDKGAPQSASR